MQNGSAATPMSNFFIHSSFYRDAREQIPAPVA